jgi:hypothetical protein
MQDDGGKKPHVPVLAAAVETASWLQQHNAQQDE